MIALILLIGAGAGFYFYSQNASASDGEIMSSGIFLNSKYGINDISPFDQQGGYSTTFDQDFLNAATKTGVPFALIKAHALTESSLKPSAQRAETRGYSYGLMQVNWWPGSGRLAKFGYPDDKLQNGTKLLDTTINTYLGACFIKDNLDRLKNLDDAINCYNTGTTVAKHAAPFDYVKKVKSYYSKILGGPIL